jgi:ferredoxin
LAAQLRLTRETPAQIAGRIDGDPKELRLMLKNMAKKGLITAGRAEGGLGFELMPFAFGFYEMQIDRIDAEMARLFENYYHKAFGQIMTIKPQVHRVVPVNESVSAGMEVRPYESAADIINNAKSWGVVDCICRKQQALIGKPCGHPLDVCMVLSEVPGSFDQSLSIRSLTREGALATLRRAAEAGLVHSVSNNQQGLWYICNCCTCSCGILRSMVKLGIANVIASSAFVLHVDEELCNACGACVERCQFNALTMDMVAEVDRVRCVGCGVCTIVCPEEAMSLVRRPEEEIKEIPVTLMDWMEERAQMRGLAIEKVL